MLDIIEMKTSQTGPFFRLFKKFWIQDARPQALINLPLRPLSSIHAPMMLIPADGIFLLWGQHT
jgi:hypothetical protein